MSEKTFGVIVALMLACGCATREIKAPEQDFPVFGPYMTKDGNMVKNPLAWGGYMLEPAATWDAENKTYTLARSGCYSSDGAVSVFRHRLLSEILDIYGTDKRAFTPAGEKDGVYGYVTAPEFVRSTDGTWRLYASACTKADKSPESRRLLVLKSHDGVSFSTYGFEAWLPTEDAAKDPTVFTFGGQMLIAYVANEQSLVVRTLSAPTAFGAEQVVVPLPAGAGNPFAVVSPSGRLYMGYNVPGKTDEEAQVRLMEVAGQMFDAKSWKPLAEPFLRAGNDFFGPFNASVFASPDGKETWLAFQAWQWKLPGEKTHPLMCVEKIGFDKSGRPTLGVPSSRTTWRRAPSGEAPYNAVR